MAKVSEMATKGMVQEVIQISSARQLMVTASWCKACGICMALCPQDVLGADEVTNKVVLVAPEECTGCGVCELSCPDYVFSIQELEGV